MSDMKANDASELVNVDNNVKDKIGNISTEGREISEQTEGDVVPISPEEDKVDDVPGEGLQDENKGNIMPSSQEQEAVIKKKFGGLVPKKPPLISKDHERAFFDSADWALGKQGVKKPKGPLEALRPKLQPTPQQQPRARRSVYASADNEEGDNSATEDMNS